jgi:hypothetical protein
MTTEQNKMYWAEWNKVREVIKAERGWSAAQADAYRHVITEQALGMPKSSTKLTNLELDRVLMKFRAILDPDNFSAQMRLQDQPEDRRVIVMNRCHDACREMQNVSRGEYDFTSEPVRQHNIAGTSHKVTGKRPQDCTAEELAKVAGVLEAHVDRIARELRAHAKKAWAAAGGKTLGEGENPYAEDCP